MRRFANPGFSARTAAPAERAGNPRVNAHPGGLSSPNGIRGAGEFVNPFISIHLPTLFWPAQIVVFGVQVDYLPQGDADAAVTISVLWKDGAADENVSPGRYSHIDLQNADLPAPPALRDMVQKDGKAFEVVRIMALAVGFSIVVLKEMGAAV